MKLEFTLAHDAPTPQRIRLPISAGSAANASNTDGAQLLLSLIVGGNNTGSVLGGAGPYYPGGPEVFEFIRGTGFSPVLEIVAGQTVSINFKFTKYPRDLKPGEQAFRCATYSSCANDSAYIHTIQGASSTSRL
jgi:hypothetical protein